jgi:LysM repeat protein
MRSSKALTALAALIVAVVVMTALAPSASSAPAGSGDGRFHVVASGDTVASIARRHGVDADTIRAANGLVGDRLYVGARLRLTNPNPRLEMSRISAVDPASARSTASTYTVRDGDVLERIARRHGVSLSSLLSANGLRSDSLIVPGDRLTIPGAGSSSSSSGNAAATTSSAGAASRPDIVCPVRGASFMNDWGFPRGGSRFHEGTDLFASTGTTIVAPASGTIRYGSNTLGGTTFTLTTSDGWVFYGAHLHAAIGSSRTVQAGSPIATVGASGNAAGGDPHLHLGVRPAGGAPINPYPALAAACR